MRIIAGAKRGKKIMEKHDALTRPTTDRVRENVFNVLTNLVDVKGARVLDLFAGTGAYALESYSRGAAEVTFNDIEKGTVEIIKKNNKMVGCNGTVLNLDFCLALEQLSSKKFEIIFLDPPYESDYIITAVEIIVKQKMLSDEGIIVVETQKNNLQFPGIRIIRKKNYGRAWLYFLGQYSQHR